MTAPPATADELRHPLVLRIAHWLLAIAVMVLIGSGWRIYDASPILPFRFPVWATLGGDVQMALAWHNDPGVATAIAWHLAAIWLFLVAALLLIGHGVVSGHFRRDWLPVTPRSFLADFLAAVRLRLVHRLGEYNAIQRAFYWGVLGALLMLLLSGLAIWKPVQLAPLTALFGGFQGARLVHFVFMTALALFLVVHIALVVLVPRTLGAMLIGHASAGEPNRQIAGSERRASLRAKRSNPPPIAHFPGDCFVASLLAMTRGGGERR